MKTNLLYPTLFAAFFWSFSLSAQTFTDITGPLGTVRSILKGPNGEWYIGSSSKGVFRSLDNGQSWSGLGGNTIMTGRINAMRYDTSGKIVAATEQGGIKTWNGTAWTSLNTGLFTACGIPIPIRDVVTDAQGRMYAGAHGYSACFANGDVYQYDGTTWNSISAGLTNKNVNALAIHPLSGELFAGTDGGVFVYNGSTWTNITAGLSDTVVHALQFAPNGQLFAGTRKGFGWLSPTASFWSNLNTGLPGDPVHAIAIDDNPAHLIISTGYSIEQVGHLSTRLYESLDGGQHWTATQYFQSTLVNAVAFMGNQQCLAGGWGIFKSTDNGQHWASANNGFTARTFNTQGRLAVTPAPNHVLFYGSDDGVFRSKDQGQTWEIAVDYLNRHIVSLLKTDRFGFLYCGTMRYLGEGSVGFGDGELYKSYDDGDSWHLVDISKDWRYMEISELSNGDLICAHGFGAQPPSATIVGSSLALSTDDGETWKDLDVKSGMAFCCTANAAGDLFVAGESQSVYRSTNGGNSFDLIVVPGQQGNVGVLEASPTGAIIMGSGGQRTLYFSNDNGTTFQPFNSPVLPDYRGVSDVIFDHDGKAYCTTTGQSGMPSLFTITPPFTSESVFTPVPGLAGSLFKMTWDDCGYLYIYRGGGILKSTEPLRPAVGACVSATTAQHLEEVNVFPNPVSSELNIQGLESEKMEASIWNLRGVKVREATISGATALSLENLVPGIYLLKIKRPDGYCRFVKLVKQ